MAKHGTLPEFLYQRHLEVGDQVTGHAWLIDSTFQQNVNESDPRSNVHYLSSSENKASKKIQACTGFESMTSAIPVQRSTKLTSQLGAGHYVGSK